VSLEEEGSTSARKRRITGTLVSMSVDSVVIQNANDDGQQSFPAASVRTFDVSTGRRSMVAQGALIGGLGLGTGLAIQSYIEESRCPSQNPPGGWKLRECGSPGGMAAVAFILNGAVGAGAGALIGAFIHTDRWQPVPNHVRGAVLPSGRGVALSFSVVR
jgi:hypothetical protein